MPKLPFSLFKRKGRKFYYVQFKDSNGDYLPAVSTKQSEESLALEISFKWLREGKPVKDNTSINVEWQGILKNIKNKEEADYICKELKRYGFLENYILPESLKAIDFCSFLDNFWDYDNSPYVKEKLRRKHGIHRNYTMGQRLAIKNFWSSFFKGRLLGDITRKDIETFMDSLDSFSKENHSLSSGWKNRILKAGTVPLKWAYNKEMIEKDITKGIIWFSGESKKRQILTPEITQLLFKIEWENNRAKLANLLASITGLRAGEIQGLRIQDLGKNCLYVNHSWNSRDKLKTTKTNEPRIVEIPFPLLINSLLLLAMQSPHKISLESYIFWAEKSSSKPMEACLFLEGLRTALVDIGMEKESTLEYEFHGWRHFFTTYMKGRLDNKLLKIQTGHKTDSMFNHYGDHIIEGDREKIRQAQIEVFGEIIPINK